MTLNRYTYVSNNPLRFVDPSGHINENAGSDSKRDPFKLIPTGRELEALIHISEVYGIEAIPAEHRDLVRIATGSMLPGYGGVKIVGAAGKVAGAEVKGIVQSRINLANGTSRFTPLRPTTGNPVSAGWEHVAKGHFNVPLSNSRSVFSRTQEEIKTILQRADVVKSPVTSIQGGQYVRTVNVGEVIGNTALKFGGKETSWIQIFTDKAGNLITAYPVPAPK
nr:hypothetical protein [Brevibacillus reuszeri]